MGNTLQAGPQINAFNRVNNTIRKGKNKILLTGLDCAGKTTNGKSRHSNSEFEKIKIFLEGMWNSKNFLVNDLQIWKYGTCTSDGLSNYWIPCGHSTLQKLWDHKVGLFQTISLIPQTLRLILECFSLLYVVVYFLFCSFNFINI